MTQGSGMWDDSHPRRLASSCDVLSPPRCSDDCWAGGRYPNGTVYADPTRFPNGMEPVVSYARSKGLVFGLYTCAGTETCVGGRPGSSGYWEQDANSYASWGVQWVKMDCESAR